MVLRKVVPSALLDENRIEVQGESNERLPRDHVYVSPTTQRVYDGAKGDTLRELPPDAVEVDKTTWWIRFLRRRDKIPPPSDETHGEIFGKQQLEIEKAKGKWYQTPEGIGKIKVHYVEMKRYFPDFELLYDDNSNDLLWNGRINGIGATIVRYTSIHSRTQHLSDHFKIVVPDLTETENAELNQDIAKYHPSISPTGALIIIMRNLLAKRVKENAVVPDSQREKETSTRDASDE